jgi:hypothetical protein
MSSTPVTLAVFLAMRNYSLWMGKLKAAAPLLLPSYHTCTIAVARLHIKLLSSDHLIN